MPINDFLPFATAGGANVQSQADYAAEAARLAGVVSGTAKSALANKSWRQSASFAAALGQFINDYGGLDALDDGSVANLVRDFARSIQSGKYAYSVAGGTPNALTIPLTPQPTLWSSLVGAPLNVTISVTNTGAATVSVPGLAGTKPLINHDGSPLAANDLLAFSIRRMIFDGVNMRVDPVLSWSLIDTRIKAFLANAKPSAVRVYNASATWTKPANLNFIRARVNGAGASGGLSSGSGGALGQHWGGAGGNGGFIEAYIFGSDLGATQDVTVGAGGTARLVAGGAQAGADGGGSQFSYLFADGGMAGGGLAGAAGDFGEGGGFTLNAPAVGYGVQGVRGQPGAFFGMPMPAILGLYGRGGNGGSAGAGANGVGGSEGIVIIEEYLLP